MKKISLITIFLATLSLTLTACDTTEDNYYKTDGSKTYTTQTSIDTQNYTMYVGKEITLVTNLLNSHISVGTLIAQGKYPIADEIVNLSNSLDLTKEAIESVETMYPPTGYEDEREAILQKLSNAYNSLESYNNALINENDKIKDCINLMEGDFISLSSSFNVLWE